MSKLAAVTTGQPTQGQGTVPTPAPPVRAVPRIPTGHQHASPLQAQRAEAEAAENLELAEFLAPGASASASINPRSYTSAPQAAMAAAWLSLTATEIEVRKYFQSIPVASGLEMLARMRKQCDLAAETLQGRMDESNTEHCSGCGKTLEEVRKTQWIMQDSEVDPTTGVPMPYRYCGPQCVRARNREKMLPPEDRNKLRFDGQEMGDVK